MKCQRGNNSVYDLSKQMQVYDVVTLTFSIQGHTLVENAVDMTLTDHNVGSMSKMSNNIFLSLT